MTTQYNVALTVSSKNRDVHKWPHPHTYRMQLPMPIPSVRQIMLAGVEINGIQRNVESPGEVLPFSEGAEVGTRLYCEEAGQFNYENELIVRFDPLCIAGSTCAPQCTTPCELKVVLPPTCNVITGATATTLTTCAPHGLAVAMCAKLALHVVGAGCAIALTPQNVKVTGESTLELTLPADCTTVSVSQLKDAWIHVAPLLQQDVQAVIRETAKQQCLDGFLPTVLADGRLRMESPNAFALIMGPRTAPLLGLSATGATCVVKTEATQAADGSWAVTGRPPPTVLAMVPPAQYTSSEALAAAVSTSMNAFVVAAANQFCFRTTRCQPHLASIHPGQYTAAQLATAVENALNAASTVKHFTVTLAFGAFTIANSATDFSLEFQVNPTSSTASNKPLPPDHMIRRLLGFDGRQYVGGRCYTGQPVPVPFDSVQRYMRYRYQVVEATGDTAVFTGLRLCAERWYAGEACEKCAAGAATAADDVVTLTYVAGATTLTLKHAVVMMGLLVGDVVAIGVPGCDCAVTGRVQSSAVDPSTGEQTVTVHVPVHAALLPFGSLTNQPVRVWLHDLPRFDLLPRSEHLSTMLGLKHAFHGGQACYASVAGINLTPHPFLLVQLGTPGHTAPYKYFAGTGKVVPVFTSLGMSSTYKQFQETYDAKLSGVATVGSIMVEFFNPDLTPYQFHGREHYLSLMLVCEGNRAILSCS